MLKFHDIIMQSKLGIQVLLIIILAILSAIMVCCSSEHTEDEREHFFDNKNKLHNGNYLATYPLYYLFGRAYIELKRCGTALPIY